MQLAEQVGASRVKVGWTAARAHGFRSTGVHSRAVLTPQVPPTTLFPHWLAPQIKDLPRTISASDEPYHISPIKEGKIRREAHKGETKIISDRDIVYSLHWHKRKQEM